MNNFRHETPPGYGRLILTRKPHQSIIIDNEIRVAISDVKGKQVSLEIMAPKTVVVDREEIFLRKINSIKNNIEDNNHAET